MQATQTWVRVSAVAGGGRWHLFDEERGLPWCGRVLVTLPTTVVHAPSRPGRVVCRDCLRAEQAAFRAADRADRKAHRARRRAARVVRGGRPAPPVTAG